MINTYLSIMYVVWLCVHSFRPKSYNTHSGNKNPLSVAGNSSKYNLHFWRIYQLSANVCTAFYIWVRFQIYTRASPMRIVPPLFFCWTHFIFIQVKGELCCGPIDSSQVFPNSYNLTALKTTFSQMFVNSGEVVFSANDMKKVCSSGGKTIYPIASNPAQNNRTLVTDKVSFKVRPTRKFRK